MQIRPQVIEALIKKWGYPIPDDKIAAEIASIEKEIEAEERKARKGHKAKPRRKATMKPGDNCWRCRHLTSRIHTAPPVFCRAYPDSPGIPFEILGGIVRHDRLLGNEKQPVFYERKREQR